MSRILLLESDQLLAANLSKCLKKAGHSVNWQVDAQAAVDVADAWSPEAVILDLLLAGRSGMEFLYEFRSYPDWQSIPVIIYSSLPVEQMRASNQGLDHLNIAAYHYKNSTTLNQLVESINLAPSAVFT